MIACPINANTIIEKNGPYFPRAVVPRKIGAIRFVAIANPLGMPKARATYRIWSFKGPVDACHFDVSRETE
jgi:hypothetical protein